ncbi:aconitase X catalytic domain-containing protein [Candidatus Micrarchaeota archaeon]|nr:aconitase X catalytic domain-containing protein [Candidatus Micrarchaeota archaeon]
MELTKEEKEMLEGKKGNAVKKSMEILVALGEIFGAEKLIDVKSVQIAGVSYDNLGDAGLEFLEEMAKDGKVKVFTTLNPAGMDLENWKELGISEEFAVKQKMVIDAFAKMGVLTTCTCTPYFVGNKPSLGEHIAWSESSAVAFANSVLGARTNREGGPSALAAALTGKTPEYGYHLDEKRKPVVTVEVKTELRNVVDFGALGFVIGKRIGNKVSFIKGIPKASIEELKSFGASIATYGGTALYHMEGITPEKAEEAEERIEVNAEDIEDAKKELSDGSEVDFVAIGCPHCSIKEMERLAELLKGKKVKKETWIAVARPVKEEAEKKGWVKVIEESGAKFAADTCFVVAPIKGRFKCMATDSAKGVFYARGKNKFKTVIAPVEKLIEIATS